MSNELTQTMTAALAEMRPRFGWIGEAPYVCAEAFIVEGATRLVDQFPASEHSEHVRIQTHLPDGIRESNHGEAPSPMLITEVSSCTQSQLSSRTIEGYHRNLTMRVRLENHQSWASLLATARFNQSVELIRDWQEDYDDVVPYFWAGVTNDVCLSYNPVRVPRNFSCPII